MKHENKLAHLGFIQLVINRLASNSFIIKGWCITLVAAITAISSKQSLYFLLTAYIPIIIFYFLDTYYLCKERQYRALYDEVRRKKEEVVDFSMKLSESIQTNNSYLSTLVAHTIWPFYLVLVLVVLILMGIDIYDKTSFL